MRKLISLNIFFVLVLSIIFISCENNKDEPLLQIDYQKVIINGIGEFSYKDSLTYAGIDSIKYQIKIVSSDGNVDLFYTTGLKEYKLLDSEWINIDSSVSRLYFYSKKDGYAQTGIKHIDFNFKSDSLINNIFIYPNPTTGIFNIKFNCHARGELLCDIFEVNGKLLTSSKNFVSIDSLVFKNDLSGVQAGLYFIKCKFGKSEKIVKIVKI